MVKSMRSGIRQIPAERLNSCQSSAFPGSVLIVSCQLFVRLLVATKSDVEDADEEYQEDDPCHLKNSGMVGMILQNEHSEL
jgi:hypothetical protein